MPRLIKISSEDGTLLEADLYGAPDAKAGAVLVHGKVFDKESWSVQAQAWAASDLSVIVPNLRGYGESHGEKDPGGFPGDVVASVAALRERGAQRISIVGASMGAVATGKAVSEGLIGPLTALILLSPRAMPFPGSLLSNDTVFVVSEHEDCASDVRGFFAAAPSPKRLVTYAGDAHAQFIFRSEHGPALQSLIAAALKPQ